MALISRLVRNIKKFLFLIGTLYFIPMLVIHSGNHILRPMATKYVMAVNEPPLKVEMNSKHLRQPLPSEFMNENEGNQNFDSANSLRMNPSTKNEAEQRRNENDYSYGGFQNKNKKNETQGNGKLLVNNVDHMKDHHDNNSHSVYLEQGGYGTKKRTLIFRSLKETEKFMQTVKDIRKSPRIVIEYENYIKKEPLFIDNDDRILFHASSKMREKMKAPTKQELQGVIEVVPHGTYKHYFECGFMSDISYVYQKRPVSKSFDIFVPLVLDTAYIFQHFYASTIPKLTQIYEYVRRPEVKILLEKPTSKNDIIYSLLERFNISGDKIEWHTRFDHSTVYGADHMLFTCNAPPTHPELWKRIRNYIGAHDELSVPVNQSKIMFMSRKSGTGAHGVRQALNEDEVLEMLRGRYGYERVIIFHGSKGLDEDLKLFSTVSVMIGVHGGAFYNLNFAPLNTAVIEFVPTLPGGTRDIPSCSTSVFWLMAEMLGQTYWRVQAASVSGGHNVVMDLDKLTRILDRVDQSFVE